MSQGAMPVTVSVNITLPLVMSVKPGVYTGFNVPALSNVPLPFVVHNKLL